LAWHKLAAMKQKKPKPENFIHPCLPHAHGRRRAGQSKDGKVVVPGDSKQSLLVAAAAAE